jgi:hypothetical protein
MLGQTASERAATGSCSDDDEIDGLIPAILAHWNPSAGTEDIRRATVDSARSGKGVI